MTMVHFKIIFNYPKCGELTALTELSMYWKGTVRCGKDQIHFYCTSKQQSMKSVKEILEEFPKLFTNIDFYAEEGIEKVSFDLAENYGIEFF